MKSRFLLFTISVLGAAALLHTPRQSDLGTSMPPTPVIGNVDVLKAKYDAWREGVIEQEQTLVVALSPHMNLYGRETTARGEARFDLCTERIMVDVGGLPNEGGDVWLVSQGADSSVAVDETDRCLKLGPLAVDDAGVAHLDVMRGDLKDAEVSLGLVVVTAPGEHPRDGGLLFGSPTLFQRMYLAELADRAAADGPNEVQVAGISFGFLTALLGVPGDFPPPDPTSTALASLIAKGEFLFFEETFKGNDRTCGTCHPLENNLTIDHKFIAGLPNKDPLFVAEFIKDLNSDANGGLRFEIPELMRRHAVILENLDGFGDLKKRFTMRGVPHVFSQGVSIEPQPGGITPPNHRTGWSGDGSPFGPVGTLLTFGTLRDFAVGAVRQHFTKTTNRVINVDFILPTPSELDAFEAFMLSLGRQQDPNLNTLVLKDPGADAGRVTFMNSACNQCHGNAGANVNGSTFNFNFDTGVEEFLQNHINDFNGTGQPRPVDGGFGTAPNGTFPNNPIPNPDGSFGDGTFNTASLVEAADTPPFFHANISNTLEDAILFYRSAEFLNSPSGVIIPFLANPQDVTNVANFLRVLNSLDNIDTSAVRLIKRAIDFLDGPFTFLNLHDVVNRLLRAAVADLCDVIEVLTEGDLHPVAIDKVKQAIGLVEQAMAPLKPSIRIDLLKKALELLQEARDDMN